MKNILLAIIAAVIIIIAVFVTIPFLPGDGTQDVDPNNPDLDAKFTQRITVLYMDGTTEDIDQLTTLSVIRNTKEINKFYHRLYVSFTDGGSVLCINSGKSNTDVTTLKGNDDEYSFVQTGGAISECVNVGQTNVLIAENTIQGSLFNFINEGTYTLKLQYDMGNSFTYTIDGGSPKNIVISSAATCTFEVLDPSTDWATVFRVNIGIGRYGFGTGDYYAHVDYKDSYTVEEGSTDYGITGDTVVECTIDFLGTSSSYVRTRRFNANVGPLGLMTWHNDILFEVPLTVTGSQDVYISFSIRVNDIPISVEMV